MYGHVVLVFMLPSVAFSNENVHMVRNPVNAGVVVACLLHAVHIAIPIFVV